MSKQRIQWHCFNEVNEKYDIIDQGGFSKTAIKGQIEESLRSLKSGDIFVEIGVLCGGSLFNFYEFVSNPEVEFVGIDVWENQTSCNGFELEDWDEEDFKKFIKVELDCRKKVENIIKDNKFNIKLIQLESTDPPLIDLLNGFAQCNTVGRGIGEFFEEFDVLLLPSAAKSPTPKAA